MTDEDRRLVAVHEAGHVIMYVLLGVPLRSVSIIPDAVSLGRAIPKRDRSPEMRTHLILGLDSVAARRTHARIMVMLAGGIAEDLQRGFPDGPVAAYIARSSDEENAMELALAMSDSPEEGYALLRWLRQRTWNAVRNPWYRRIEDRLVPVLLEHGDLSGAEVEEIVRPIVDEVLDISPKTRRGRRHLRWLRLRARTRRFFRWITRR